MVRLKLYTPRQLMRPFLDWDEMLPALTGEHSGINVYEKDGKVYVEAPVPGVKPENVEVEFEEGVLRIHAKEEESEEEKQKKGWYKEERVSEFSYTTTLPRPVESDKISAKVEHGVVVVEAPIAEAAKPKRIQVQTK